MIGRQKMVGWVLVCLSAAFIAYFLKVKVLSPGPALVMADWLRFMGSIVTLMIGTANVRLAAARERSRKEVIQLNSEQSRHGR